MHTEIDIKGARQTQKDFLSISSSIKKSITTKRGGRSLASQADGPTKGLEEGPEVDHWWGGDHIYIYIYTEHSRGSGVLTA